MRRLILAGIAATALAACSTPQATQYFTLPDSQYSLPPQRGSEIAVRVILSEPLNNGGLVYQTDAYRINFARKISIDLHFNRSNELIHVGHITNMGGLGHDICTDAI